MPPARRQLLRDINRSQVLNIIRTQGPVSRINISRLTGLSQSTVTSIAASLMEEAIILETQVGDSTGGRPPILLDLNPDSLYVIGIKLTEYHAYSVLANLKADIVDACQFEAPTGEHTISWGVHFIQEAVQQLMARNGLKRNQVAGLGIGMAGIFADGVCQQSAYFDWAGQPVADMVEEGVGLPTYIDNDVNTLTIAEEWFGHGNEVDNLIVVTLGRGVGMGLIIDGRFYGGANGGAGQFGHTLVDPNGPMCPCGKHGCLEVYVNERALLEAANAVVDVKVTQANLTELALVHQQVAEAIAKRGHLLGARLADVINLIDPARLVITGEGTWIGDLLFKPMRDAVETYTLPNLLKQHEIVVQEWGEETWAHGAACLVLREVYKSPVAHFESSV